MASSQPGHRLTHAELRSLAAGEFPLTAVRRLRAAQLSKNLLLVTALRQALPRLSPQPAGLAETAALVEEASAVLAEVQLRSPAVAAEVLSLPHLGMWAADSYSRLRAATAATATATATAAATASQGQPQPDALFPHDLASFAAFAAVGALRTGLPFELRLPIRDGLVLLPSLGAIRLSGSGAGQSGWAVMRSDDNGVRMGSDAGEVSLPARFFIEPTRNLANWSPVPRIRVEAAGLALDVMAEITDPFLAHLGQPETLVRAAWQAQLAAAWAILARHHRQVAEGLVTVLTTLIPLAESPTGQLESATSGWAWGAIGLSLIDDEALLAETLVHEFHHLVLAAVEDLTPLVEAGTGELGYVAWRDDPRPAAAIMHGTFAQLAVTSYWGRQRLFAAPADRYRCDVEFARGRRAGLAGAITLSASPLLTGAGRIMASSMREQLELTQRATVCGQAELTAGEIAAEHALRWRIAHKRPDEQAVALLAARWLEARDDADRDPQPSSALIPWTRSPGAELAGLLELRYRDPARLSKLRGELGGVAAVHLTLLAGEVMKAQAEYLRLIAADGSVDAWIGLILARHRLSRQAWRFPVTCHPEIAIAVHDRVRALSPPGADTEALVSWLARNWLTPADAEH